ncbi:MAG: DUF4115 domain-containing protein [Alphaproteobacteria bacterium]|nr:DUF4115 domain-containing protein [Alphaproteobacteria bacterium]
MLHRESDTQDDETTADRAAGRESHVGALLRETRLGFGLSVDDVATHLRIRRDFIAAIEERRVEGVPAPAYLLGFLRSYATFLGLDPDEVVRRFRNDVSGINRRPTFRPPEPVPERGIPAGAMMVVGIVLAAGAYGGWYWYSGGADRPQAIVPPVPERLAVAPAPLVPGAPTAPRPAAAPAPGAPALVAAGATQPGAPAAPAAGLAQAAPGTGPVVAGGGVAIQAPFSFDPATVPTVRPPAAAAALPPPSPAAAGALPGAQTGTFNGRPLPGFVGPGAAPWTPTPSVAEPPQADRAAAADPGSAGPALPLPPRLGAGRDPEASTTIIAAAPITAPAASPGAGDSRFVLHARADSWVSLRDGTGSNVFNRVLRAGETYRVPARPGMVLTTGNAGGLEIQLDGQAMPTLGGVGQVRRDLPLEPERLRGLLSAGR